MDKRAVSMKLHTLTRLICIMFVFIPQHVRLLHLTRQYFILCGVYFFSRVKNPNNHDGGRLVRYAGDGNGQNMIYYSKRLKRKA